ncbi:hypothetical protein ABZY09_21445 [Streptomyces sp. NPDC002928]|uniref:hypothetical protein n=1 Tax=Streptomyces sp. NPDC002928 TaxID=3154440 RepID=UPI0033A5430C
MLQLPSQYVLSTELTPQHRLVMGSLQRTSDLHDIDVGLDSSEGEDGLCCVYVAQGTDLLGQEVIELIVTGVLCLIGAVAAVVGVKSLAEEAKDGKEDVVIAAAH